VRLLLPVVLLSTLCFSQTSQNTPAEVPVENEPHHHLVFENEYVRVFKVEVAPHEATLVHRHKRDYVVVTIGDAEVTNAIVGKEPKKWSFKDGDVTFLEAAGEKSFAHKAVNESQTPFRNYTIELKKQLGKTNRSRTANYPHLELIDQRDNWSTFRVLLLPTEQSQVVIPFNSLVIPLDHKSLVTNTSPNLGPFGHSFRQRALVRRQAAGTD